MPIDYTKIGLPVKKFAIAHDGDPVQQEIIAAVTGKKIIVLSYVLTNGGDVAGTATWQSADTNLSGAMGLGARGSIVADHAPRGHIETAAGEALNITVSGTNVPVGGHGVYVEV